MFETILPFVPAISTVLGSLIGAKGQHDANEANQELAREQMAFQERMSSSAYQRATKDMQLAGLNPMLAYSQGGASAPVGSLPTMQNVGAAAVNSGQAGAQAVAALQQIQQQKATIAQTEATTKKIQSETMEKTLNTALLAAQVRREQFTGDKTFYDSIQSDIAGKAAHEDYQSMMRTAGWDQKRLTDIAQSAQAQMEALKTSHTFAEDVARRKAESKLTQLEVPKAEAEAGFYEGIGEYSPQVKALLEGIKRLLGIGMDLKRYNILRKGGY